MFYSKLLYKWHLKIDSLIPINAAIILLSRPLPHSKVARAVAGLFASCSLKTLPRERGYTGQFPSPQSLQLSNSQSFKVTPLSALMSTESRFSEISPL